MKILLRLAVGPVQAAVDEARGGEGVAADRGVERARRAAGRRHFAIAERDLQPGRGRGEGRVHARAARPKFGGRR